MQLLRAIAANEHAPRRMPANLSHSQSLQAHLGSRGRGLQQAPAAVRRHVLLDAADVCQLHTAELRALHTMTVAASTRLVVRRTAEQTVESWG